MSLNNNTKVKILQMPRANIHRYRTFYIYTSTRFCTMYGYKIYINNLYTVKKMNSYFAIISKLHYHYKFSNVSTVYWKIQVIVVWRGDFSILTPIKWVFSKPVGLRISRMWHSGGATTGQFMFQTPTLLRPVPPLIFRRRCCV